MPERIRAKLRKIGRPRPCDLYEAALRVGVRIDGHPQIEAVLKKICVLTSLHMQRLWQIHMEGGDPVRLPPKENFMLVGPTGSGKTYLAEKLFGEVLGLPFAIEDMSQFTASGYVGRDAPSLLNRLIDQADGDAELASIGVVVLDEIDKISRRGGPGRDVKGDVAGELLRTINGGETLVSFRSGYMGLSGDKRSDLTLRTDHMLFIGCGAFSRIARIINRRVEPEVPPFGFKPQIAKTNDEDKAVTLDDLIRYGLQPELAGRFGHIIELPPPPADFLRRLARDEVERRANLWQSSGAELPDELKSDTFINHIVEIAEKRPTGARAIPSVVSELMAERAFAVFSALPSDSVPVEPGSSEVPAAQSSPVVTKGEYYGTRFCFSLVEQERKQMTQRIDRISITLTTTLWRKLVRASRERIRVVLASQGFALLDFRIAERLLEIQPASLYLVNKPRLVRELHQLLSIV